MSLRAKTMHVKCFRAKSRARSLCAPVRPPSLRAWCRIRSVDFESLGSLGRIAWEASAAAPVRSALFRMHWGALEDVSEIINATPCPRGHSDCPHNAITGCCLSIGQDF